MLTWRSDNRRLHLQNSFKVLSCPARSFLVSTTVVRSTTWISRNATRSRLKTWRDNRSVETLSHPCTASLHFFCDPPGDGGDRFARGEADGLGDQPVFQAA